MTAYRMRTRLSRVASLGLTSLVAFSLVLSATFTADAAKSEKAKPSKLGPHDLELIAAARANGESTILVLIASGVGKNSSVASAVAALGGAIRYRDDGLDYVRARISVDAAEKVASLPGIDAVDVDEIIALDDPSPEGIAPIIPQPAPGAATPNNNPYMPTRDTGAAQFVAAHPTWDGRGITIGQVDTGIGLDHPALQTTTTGERKIIGWVTGTDPIDDNDPTWINMATQVTGPTFTFGTPAVTYTAPAAGAFRFGIFNERDARFGGELGNDANRDGNPAGSSGLFGVLWDTTTNQVWVDTNQDRSFADQTAMQNYNVNYDIGWFGTDNPTTPIAERLPFVVQTDAVNGYVNIGVPSGAHATHVAGIMAANGMFGGAMTGAAPGAKLVSSRACLFIAGCTAHALLEGMIDLVQNMNVNVVNMSIGGLPALNDGNNTRAQVYDRLIGKSKVQMFISAGNSGPGINTIGDPSVATKVMSVGAYITQSTYLADYGTDPGKADNLLYFTSRGPREDGGFKPDIVAPGAAVSTTPLWQGGVGLPYALPVGYQLQNGTSMASPAAAGAAALLLSAAKATDTPAKPDQLRQAIKSTARFIDPTRFQAYDQGNGLIDIVSAWDLLKTNVKTVDISSSVPVNTVLSGFLATPGVGVGIYDREGVTVGTPYTRTYTFNRGNGDGPTATYNLSWVGNDGTFATASSITLAKRSSANLTININALTAGAHAAILNLDNPATAGIDYQVMNTVIAPYEFTAAGGFSQVTNSTIDRAQAKHYFFRIPAGTPALKVDFTGPSATAGTGQARFLRWHPYGLPIDDNAVSQCYTPPGAAGCSTGSPNSRTTSNPLAGVWEVSVDARRTSDADGAAYTLTTSILGATVSPNPDVIATATIGVPIARSYTITNQFGAFTGRAVGTTLGSARRGVFTIADLETQEYLVTITAGTTSLRATIGSPSDPAADLDLFVYNCTTGSCVLRGQSADGDSEESVTVTTGLTPGVWKVVVDGFAVPAGTTTYNYIDVFTNAAFGSIAITDANALRPSSASWIVPGSVTANSAPAAGRVLYGNVQVRTDTNILVGSGDVVINAVTP